MIEHNLQNLSQSLLWLWQPVSGSESSFPETRKLNFFKTVNQSKVIWDPQSKPRGLLGGRLNIRSVISEIDQINHILTDSNLDFLCLSETWLHSNSPSAAIDVPGYKVFRRDRPKGKGGGVMIYIKDNFHCNQIKWSSDNNLECIALIVTLATQMSFVLVQHRPPSSNNRFYEDLKNILKECLSRKEIILMGDFNINWEDKTNRKALR